MASLKKEEGENLQRERRKDEIIPLGYDAHFKKKKFKFLKMKDKIFFGGKIIKHFTLKCVK